MRSVVTLDRARDRGAGNSGAARRLATARPGPRPARAASRRSAVGYADGWHRAHSNTGAAYFDGHPVPLVGRVSMDLTTFDVTDQPAVQPGSWLELLGPHRGGR